MIRVASVCVLILLAACDATPSASGARSGDGSVSQAEMEALRTLAETACRCDRTSADASCWGEFNAKVSTLEESVATATACAPVSTWMRCFNEEHPDGGFCVVTGHTLSGGEAPRLCSEREAQIVEATFYGGLAVTGDDYGQAWDAAEEAARRLVRGDDVPMPEADLGCTG